jgi:cell wall-associated NlpC family hydrolase
VAARSGGISGIGLSLATAGAFLMYVGIRNVPIVQGLREITSGNVPTPRETTKTSVEFVLPGSGGTGGGGAAGEGTVRAGFSGGANPQFAQTAQKYIGIPYVWGGTKPKPGFDCSGLHQYVIAEVTGIPQKNIPRTTYTQVVWNQFKTISRSQLGAGDFVYWNGHCGIAINNNEVIHAPRPGSKVKIAKISEAGPVGLSPIAYKRYVGKTKSTTAEV